MPPEWISAISGAVVGIGTLALGFLGWKVTHRTQKASERDQARVLDHAAFDQMTSVTAMVQAERDRTDQKLGETNERLGRTEAELRQARNEIDVLTLNFRRLEGRLVAAIDYIRRLLAWAGHVVHPEPHPSIPDDIADLINTRDKS
jgi:hypothetical protein